LPNICKAAYIELNSSLLPSSQIYISILICNLKKHLLNKRTGTVMNLSFISRASWIFVLLLLSFSSALRAAGYPEKPVKIVVPFAAGGPADNYARFLAKKLQDEFNTPLVVEDKPGAGSIIGTDFVVGQYVDAVIIDSMGADLVARPL
jgi:hypothetical protein